MKKNYILIFSFMLLAIITKAQTCFTTVSGISGKTVGIIVSETDTIYGGTYGIIIKNQTTISYTTANGLPSNNVSSVAVSNNGDLWVGTDNGAAKFDGINWFIYNSTNGLVHNLVNVIYCDDTYIWIGTQYGLSRFDGTDFTNFDSNSFLLAIEPNVVGIARSGEFCYLSVGSMGDGAIRKFNASVESDAFDIGEWAFPEYGEVNGCWLKNETELLVAADNGLVKVALPELTMEFISNTTIGATKYTWEVVSNFNGDIYISLANPNGYDRIDGQLFKYNGTEWSEISALSDPNIWALTVSEENLFIGTATGAEMSIICSDFDAPTAPTDLLASNITEWGFALSWTESVDNVAVTGYDIYVDDVYYSTVSETTAIVNPCTNMDGCTGAVYQIKVVAKDASGNFSEPAELTVTLADNSAPTTPVITGYSYLTQTSFNLEWSASTDNAAVTGYEIYKDGILFGTNTTPTQYNSFSITDLTPNTSYSMTVRAFDAAGNYSELSTPYVVTTLSAPFVTLSTNSLIIGAEANSTATFDITSNTTWTIECNQTWLSINPYTSSNNSSVTITAEQNPTTSTRTATLTISATDIASQTVIITQDANTMDINGITNNKIIVYPNPASEYINIENLSKDATISLYNICGTLILNTQNSKSINISNISKGIYLLKINDNGNIYYSKFIKE